jgi:hypothetical protein
MSSCQILSAEQPEPGLSPEMVASMIQSVPRPASSRLQFGLATSLDEVLDAWGVVYEAYVRTGLIDPNPYGLHAAQVVVTTDTAVAVGRADGIPAVTATAICDGPDGLPLDTVYSEELRTLRWQGRYLVEVGLVADARPDICETSTAFFEVIRYTFYYALHVGATDIICGMHPRRARLYQRLFGFKPWGSPRTYSTVRNHPVILMRGETMEMIRNANQYRAVENFVQRPVPTDELECRHQFTPESLQDPRVCEYMQYLRRKRMKLSVA